MKWNLETRKIKELHEYSKNPRTLSKDQAAQLQKSITKFGLCEPIVINQDNTIIGGHQRVRTMHHLGKKIVDVYVPNESLSKKEVEELCIRLNKNIGSWDWDILANEWDVDDVLDWGFTEKELDFDLNQIEGTNPEDDAPNLKKETNCKVGDTFRLGRHYLHCGDCTKVDNVNILLQGNKVQMLCTDPPYGVDYMSGQLMNDLGLRKTKQTPIQNDQKKDYRKFFSNFLCLIPWSEKNTSYIFMSGQELHNLRLAMEDTGMKWGDYLVWVKNYLVLSRKDYNAKHEFIVYGWKGTHKFYGPTNSTTILEYQKPQVSKEHPTMKPIDLVEQLIKDGSKKGFNVYDPFAGSGTMLLACEALDRICFSMEISPHYCDVIIDRWKKYREENYLSSEVENLSEECKLKTG